MLDNAAKKEEPMATRWVVTREQFDIDDEGITHKPTGYNFTPYPGSPTDGVVNKGLEQIALNLFASSRN